MASPTARPVGDVRTTWGESLRWDDRRQRLYLVDCATSELLWLEGAEPPAQRMQLPSLPTGVVLAEDGRLVIALDGGLYVVDPDVETAELLTPYPDGIGQRANDAAADLDGNIVTGTLNFGPAPGSYWWFSASVGWRKLDDGIENANGPVVLDVDGTPTLVFADTGASALYAYPYDGAEGVAGDRRVFADTSALAGRPDGACADAGGGVWSCLLGCGKLARYTAAGTDEVLDVPVELPSDVTFGGPNLDRLFFVSIAMSIGGVEVVSPDAGALMVIDDSGHRGREEPRVRL